MENLTGRLEKKLSDALGEAAELGPVGQRIWWSVPASSWAQTHRVPTLAEQLALTGGHSASPGSPNALTVTV